MLLALVGQFPSCLATGRKVCFLKSGARIVKSHVIAMVSFKIFFSKKGKEREVKLAVNRYFQQHT